jgi:hypothetical protein
LDQLADPDFNGTVLAPTDLGFTAFLNATNTSLEALEADNSTLGSLVVGCGIACLHFSTFRATDTLLPPPVACPQGMHIIPELKYFPPATLRQGLQLPTLQGSLLTVDRRCVCGSLACETVCATARVAHTYCCCRHDTVSLLAVLPELSTCGQAPKSWAPPTLQPSCSSRKCRAARCVLPGNCTHHHAELFASPLPV